MFWIYSGNGSADENSSFPDKVYGGEVVHEVLDKVDGGEVVHQLEVVLVQGGRNLFEKKIKNPKKLRKRKYETERRINQ